MSTPEEQRKPEVKEWTVMFYFASDNPLASTMISQLKAIKDAGHHPLANVLAQFDPYIVNTPSHIFEVGGSDRFKDPDEPQEELVSKDTYVRGLLGDKLWSEKDTDLIRKDIVRLKPPSGNKDWRAAADLFGVGEENGDGKARSLARGRGQKRRRQRPTPSTEMSGEQPPRERLYSFLDFCRENYPARHYMLIILGHGLAVSNDLFLYDEHAPQSTLLLCELGDVLRQFRIDVEADKEPGVFELIGFHSCSMSGLEVAYELKNTARYMLASQGPAFVGSWPYRQILRLIFNSIDLAPGGASRAKVDDMIREMFYPCLHNSQDFQLAGYSFDISLCDLKKLEEEATAPLRELSKALIAGLDDPRAKELILLAHWDAQSFWQETYTDIYDFCFCLSRRVCGGDPSVWVKEQPSKPAEPSAPLNAIHDACEKVMKMLQRGRRGDNDHAVVRAESAGPLYQYAHGLSVFFPWAAPVGSRLWNEQYEHYRFSKQTSWMEFLKAYFEKTMRIPRDDERDRKERHDDLRPNEVLFHRVVSNAFGSEGHLGPGGTIITIKSGPNDPLGKYGQHDPTGKYGPNDPTGKYGPNDPTGEDVFFAIKNYPPFTRLRADRRGGDKRRNGAQAKSRPAAQKEAESGESPRTPVKSPRKRPESSGRKQ